MAQGKKGRSGEIDEHVGRRLRQRRVLLGLSQEKLAESVGITFQQIQKYENGANRISAGRLYEFAQLLKVSVLFFYQGLGELHETEIQLPHDCLTVARLVYEVPEDRRKEAIHLVKMVLGPFREQPA